MCHTLCLMGSASPEGDYSTISSTREGTEALVGPQAWRHEAILLMRGRARIQSASLGSPPMLLPSSSPETWTAPSPKSS